MKAQTYTLDLMMALIFTSIVAVSVIVFFVGLPSVQHQQHDAKTLAHLITQPYPVPYNETTVLQPGFIQHGRLNLSLFASFQALPEPLVKQLTGIQSDFFINITDNFGLSLQAGTPPMNATDIHLVKRYAAHNGSLARIEVLAWQ